MNAPSEAYRDLGGNHSDMSPESEEALYRIGMGKPDWRRRIEARLNERERQQQDTINKAGAAAFRSAGGERSEPYPEETLDQMRERVIRERNRTRIA
jgi:hypothetical protein